MSASCSEVTSTLPDFLLRACAGECFDLDGHTYPGTDVCKWKFEPVKRLRADRTLLRCRFMCELPPLVRSWTPAVVDHAELAHVGAATRAHEERDHCIEQALRRVRVGGGSGVGGRRRAAEERVAPEVGAAVTVERRARRVRRALRCSGWLAV